MLGPKHYNDIIMSVMACQIISLTIVFTRWPVNSPHKGPVTRKMFPFDDVIMVKGVPGDSHQRIHWNSGSLKICPFQWMNTIFFSCKADTLNWIVLSLTEKTLTDNQRWNWSQNIMSNWCSCTHASPKSWSCQEYAATSSSLCRLSELMCMR